MPWVVSAIFPSHFCYSLPVAFFSVGAAVGLVVFNRFKYYGAIFLLIIGMMGRRVLLYLASYFPPCQPS